MRSLKLGPTVYLTARSAPSPHGGPSSGCRFVRESRCEQKIFYRHLPRAGHDHDSSHERSGSCRAGIGPQGRNDGLLVLYRLLRTGSPALRLRPDVS